MFVVIVNYFIGLIDYIFTSIPDVQVFHEQEAVSRRLEFLGGSSECGVFVMIIQLCSPFYMEQFP